MEIAPKTIIRIIITTAIQPIIINNVFEELSPVPAGSSSANATQEEIITDKIAVIDEMILFFIINFTSFLFYVVIIFGYIIIILSSTCIVNII